MKTLETRIEELGELLMIDFQITQREVLAIRDVVRELQTEYYKQHGKTYTPFHKEEVRYTGEINHVQV